MKIAVFSDIHGNIEALDLVLEMIEKESPDKTIFLGDIFQRGENAAECVERLMQSNVVCLKGNCELYLDKGVDIDPDVLYLRSYYNDIRRRLTAEQRAFVHGLPLLYKTDANGHKLLFSHFLIKDISAEYPFCQLSDMGTETFANAAALPEYSSQELVIVGHTHQSFEYGNIVGIPSTGLGTPVFALIDAEKTVNFRLILQKNRLS